MPRSARAVFAAEPTSQDRDSCALSPLPPGEQANTPPIFLQEKENITLPLFPRIPHTPLLLRRFARELFARATRGPSAAGPSRRLLRPSHKQKMRARSIAPRTRSKSVDFSLKKAHVGTPGLHALASAARTYSLTARVHSCPFSFLLFYKEKKKENRSKFSRFEYIARTHFVRPHDVRDWPVAPRPLKFM